MLAYYAPDKSEQGIANQLGFKSSWQSKDYMVAMRKYSGVKVMQIIGEIRYCDAHLPKKNFPPLSTWHRSNEFHQLSASPLLRYISS